MNHSPRLVLLKLITLLVLLTACATNDATIPATPIAATTEPASVTAPPTARPTDTRVPTLEATPTAIPTPALTATPAFEFQKLVGVWNVKDVYVRFTAAGKYAVAGTIARFVDFPIRGTIVVEGDLVKFSGEAGCQDTEVGVYRLTFLGTGERHTLTLVNDPCEERAQGPVPAASTYRKLEARVLPGAYTAEVTQAEAEAAGGGDLLKYVGAWELQLNADNTFVLLQNGQSIAEGNYLSADIQFTLNHADVCPNFGAAVYKAVVDEVGVTFYQNASFTRDYECKDMLLILTRHLWTKK